jgi:hypothetical protein
MTTIRDTLAAEAAEAETRHAEAPGRLHRTHSTAGTTSQVYTLRMPAERLTELREVAEQSGEQPSTLMRRWVLQRLDTERTHQPELADVQRALTDALHTLDHIAHQRSA